MPPTPTPFPAGNTQITIQVIDAWEFSDWAIHGWQLAGNWSVVIQAIVLLFLIGFGVILLRGWLDNFSTNATVSVGGDD